MNKDYKEDLTPEELEIFRSEFDKAVDEDLRALLEIENSEDAVTYYPKIEDVDYFNYKSLNSDSIYTLDPDEMLGVIKEFKEKCEPINGRIGFYVDQEVEYSYGDNNYVDDIFFEAHWKEVKTEITEEVRNSGFKNIIKYWLRPDNVNNYARDIDCKLLTLFKDGKIDWKTLRVLTYSDCDI